MRLLQIGHPSAIRYMKQAEEQGIGRGVSEAEQCHVLKDSYPYPQIQNSDVLSDAVIATCHTRYLFYLARCSGPTK